MAIEVKVGVLTCNTIEIKFNGVFHETESGKDFSGAHVFKAEDFPNNNKLLVATNTDSDSFEVKNVTIGKDFHWQRKECQRFKGNLLLKSDGKEITLINILSIESYLESVISSEMSANASLEFLKAHAVISRSWVTARILNRAENSEGLENNIQNLPPSQESGDTTASNQAKERIKWYDDNQHIGFDVCADDHCQRYQGISRITNNNAIRAVKETAGMVLTYNGKIADTRFSKCCGGAFERFENCWEDIPHPYLKAGRDFIGNKQSAPIGALPDLSIEKNARQWIENKPTAFCNTSDIGVLRQVLNNYDLETTDFYRWEVTYSDKQLSQIVKDRSGIDFGLITDLIPIQRGVSGRIVKLKLIGTKKSMIIGKELEIRRTLSESHLYSSAFTVTKITTNENNRNLNTSSLHGNKLPVSSKFILKGAGWGHGVGLCQIGAAVMAEQGYDFRQILNHYYPGTQITELHTLPHIQKQ